MLTTSKVTLGCTQSILSHKNGNPYGYCLSQNTAYLYQHLLHQNFYVFLMRNYVMPYTNLLLKHSES